MNMDEDCDAVLVVDLDDEKDEMQDDRNDIDEEMRPINYNHCSYDKNKSLRQHYYEETSRKHIQSSETNLEDMQVIDVDDDDTNYEDTAKKIINSVNETEREYLNYNKLLNEAKDYRIHKRDSLERDNNLVIKGYTNKTHDQKPYNKNVIGNNQIGSVRDQAIHSSVKENREEKYRTSFESYRQRYSAGHKPHIMKDDRTLRADGFIPNNHLPCTEEAIPHAYIEYGTSRSEIDSMDDYYHIMNRNKYNRIHRPKIHPRDDFYIHRPMNRSYFHHLQRLLSTDYIHSEMIRDPYSYIYRPDMLSIDEYRRAEINRAQHFYDRIPRGVDHLVRFDDRYAIERDAYNYNYRQKEIVGHNDFRNDMRNTLAYSKGNDLYDYWQAQGNRDVNRLEGGISSEYERSIRTGREYSNAYEPPVGLGLDPYIPVELANISRPDLAKLEAYREPMLTRNTYPETAGMYGYRPQTSNYRTRLYDAHRNNEAKLNMFHKQETNNVPSNRLTRKSVDVTKLKTILCPQTQVYELPLNMHKAVQKSADSNKKGQAVSEVRNDKAVLSVNEPDEIHISVCNPGIPVTIIRPDTVILSTGNIYHNNTPADTDVTATSKPINDVQTTADEIKYHTAKLGEIAEKNKLENNNTHERKRLDREDKGLDIHGEEKDSIRFLVVFFTRVKELVRATFPGLAKSLEKEIQNLGVWTNSGRMKTDIQYVCPLYCSVSTYSFPRFDNTNDDNKIEKDVNRTKICDVCTCIQNCYKLFKKKYYNLISAANGDKPDNIVEKMHESDNINLTVDGIDPSIRRAQTVICRRKDTDCQEGDVNQFSSNDAIDIYKTSFVDPVQYNIDQTTINKHTQSKLGNKNHVTNNLNERRLLHSLSVLNFNLPKENTENSMVSSNQIPRVYIDKGISLQNTIKNNQVEIEVPDQNLVIDDEEEISINIKNKAVMDDNIRDGVKANLILSSPFNGRANSDIIAKLKDKISKKPDAIFTCHICTCNFTYFTVFLSHMQKEHNLNGINEDIPDDCIERKCPFCGIYSKQKYHNDHVRRAHPEIFTHKGETTKIEMAKVNTKRKSLKRKFIFTCLVCHKNLKSMEVKRHREKEHKGLKIEKMFTKKLSVMD